MSILENVPPAASQTPGSRPGTPADSCRPGSPSLDGSWYPVGTPTHSDSDHTDLNDDDESSGTLGSSLVLSSDGSSGTRRDDDDLELDHRPSSPVASELLGGESYIDAEAPSTIMSSSLSSSAPPDHQLPLIYPYADLGDSFASSTTGSDTTPHASVGTLQSVTNLIPVTRSSRYQLKGHRLDVDPEEQGQCAVRAPIAQGPGVGGASEMDSVTDPEFAPPTPHQPPSSPTQATQQNDETEKGLHASRRRVVDNARLRLAMTTARGIRQRWNWRMSLLALTSIVSIAVATVQYLASGSPPAATAPTNSAPAQKSDPRSYSILDYLSVPSLSGSMLSETGSSSYIPDVRLIKNALSLSTKSAALAPAELPSTSKVHKSPANLPTSKSAGPTSHSLSLSLRNTDVGLTTLIDASARWHRSIRNLTKGSRNSPADVPTSAAQVDRTQVSYGQMMLADIKTAWTRAISDFNYTDFIHFIRDQIFATVKTEINEALAVAQHVAQLSRNVTQALGIQFYNRSAHIRALVHGQLGQYLGAELHQLFVDNYHNLNTTRAAARQRLQDTAQKAKASLDVLHSEAAMTTKMGKDAIYKARAGLDHLIAEAQRLRGVEKKALPLPLEMECRAAHCRGRNKEHSRRWSRRRSAHGRTTTVPIGQTHRRPAAVRTSWTEKLFQAAYDAAPAFIR